jgi:hypothetical protein
MSILKKSRTEKVLDYRNHNYQEFLEILIEELLAFCKDDDVLLTELVSHLDSTEIRDDVKYVISKMRDDKINSILDEIH